MSISDYQLLTQSLDELLGHKYIVAVKDSGELVIYTGLKFVGEPYSDTLEPVQNKYDNQFCTATQEELDG